jgi:membrane protein YdbS with pleckstrin-like domain
MSAERRGGPRRPAVLWILAAATAAIAVPIAIWAWAAAAETPWLVVVGVFVLVIAATFIVGLLRRDRGRTR